MNDAGDKPLRALIADDEPAARLALTKRLEALKCNITICGEATNGKEAEEMIAAIAPDVVFLDIAMPGRDGLSLARQLVGQSAPLIVFLTAYGDRAVEAFETDAVDYLMKPVSAERLSQALRRVRSELEKRRQLKLTGELRAIVDQFDGSKGQDTGVDPTLCLDTGQGVVRLRETNICWVEAAGEYACVYANNETHIVRETLKRLESDLLSDRFFRIHRQTIVNLDKIDRIINRNGDHIVRVENGREFMVSRRKAGGLKSIFATRTNQA